MTAAITRDGVRPWVPEVQVNSGGVELADEADEILEAAKPAQRLSMPDRPQRFAVIRQWANLTSPHTKGLSLGFGACQSPI
jgi:hypothetical protein